jgi:hypothetical protein
MTRLGLAAVLLMSVACGSQVQPASPTTPSFTLSVLIFENRAGTKQPVVGANVDLWSGTAWYFRGNNLMTDTEGRFVAKMPVNGVFTIVAGKPGYVQPCDADATGQVPNASLEVELVSTASLTTGNPQPLMTTRPLVSGFVFEMTPDGPKGVPGAYVYVEAFPDVLVAETMTDLTGHFTMCNGRGYLSVDKSGYSGPSAGISLSDGMVIELKRQKTS